MTSPIDDLDARLIALMAAEPRIGLMEASRRLGLLNQREPGGM